MIINGVGLFVRNPIFENYFEQQGIFFHTFDIENTGDLMLWKKPPYQVDFILGFPPCTYFSQARKIPTAHELAAGLSYFHLAISICSILKPKFWILENPAKSRVWHYIGRPRQIINQATYGHSALKPTGLYGDFDLIKGFENPTMDYKALDKLTLKGRDYTPLPLINAIWQCNKHRLKI